jgi:cell division septation protein DedD
VDPRLRHRIMIAVIIIALVVIFVPIPFGRQENAPPAHVEAIPPAPQPVATQPADSAQAQRIVNGFVPAAIKPRVKPPVQSVKAAKPESKPKSVAKPAPAVKKPVVHHLKYRVKPHVKAKSVVKPTHKSHRATLSRSERLKPLMITPSDLQNRAPVINIRNYDYSSSNLAKTAPPKTKTVSPKAKTVSIHQLKLAKQADKAWIVQLGSFAHASQTASVVQALQKKDYPAFSYVAKINDKVMHRVYVGPFLHRDQAKAALKVIDKKFRLSGYIHTFNATD